MTRYLASDLHLDHENIIEYCDRPFDDVEEMNRELIDNWNDVIGTDDVVFFLGDLGFMMDEAGVQNALDKLNGRIVFIEGNHDDTDRYVSGLNTHQYYILSRGETEVMLTHRPQNCPSFWDDWVIHGHHHNNHPDEYPFVNPRDKLVNISVELTNYKPVEVRYVLECLEAPEWLDTVPEE